jgi:iron(III) transport system permease protein
MLMRKMIFWVFLVVIGGVILYPMGWLVGGTGLRPASVLAFLEDERVVTLLLRTIGMGVLGTLASGTLGTFLAFLVKRTDIPGKRIVSTLTLASYMTPSFLLAFAYVMMLAPNSGLINRLIEQSTGISRAFNVFGTGGFVLLATFEATPIVYLIMSHVLSSMHRSLEEGARILGASTWRVLRTITFPLALPGLAAASLLVFVNVISLYGVPAVLGVPVVTTEIQALFSWPPKYDQAALFAVSIILLSLVAVFLNRTLIQGQERYATVTGRWVPPEDIKLGRWRLPALFLALVYLSFSVVIPYLILAIASLSKNWTLGVSGSNFTLYNYTRLFQDQYNIRAMTNSLVLAVAAATLGVTIGFVVAYIEHRATNFKGRRLLDYLAMLPWGIPSIALGAALIVSFTRPPVLYGTLWILLYSYFVKFMPLAVRATSSAIKQVQLELEEAARISGASDWRTVLGITIPLVRGGLVAGWFLMFFPSLRELSSSILLISPGHETLAVAALTAWESVNFEGATALAVTTLAISVVPWILISTLNRGMEIEIA